MAKAKSKVKPKVTKKRAATKKVAKPTKSKDILKQVGIDKVKPAKSRTKRVKYIVESVPEKYCFVTVDGTKINNLKELAHVLEKMSEDTYAFHSNQDKSDFSNWIKEIVGEVNLAEKLHKKSKKDSHVEVLKHIVKELT